VILNEFLTKKVGFPESANIFKAPTTDHPYQATNPAIDHMHKKHTPVHIIIHVSFFWLTTLLSFLQHWMLKTYKYYSMCGNGSFVVRIQPEGTKCQKGHSNVHVGHHSPAPADENRLRPSCG
jgi:hypothetical protein